jgi:hypothetical protein
MIAELLSGSFAELLIGFFGTIAESIIVSIAVVVCIICCLKLYWRLSDLTQRISSCTLPLLFAVERIYSRDWRNLDRPIVFGHP